MPTCIFWANLTPFSLQCRADTHLDADLEAGWLRGKVHPLTGAAMAAEGLSLPPGSIVSMFAHVAHAVEPRLPRSRHTRWGSLLCYRDGERKGGGAPPPSPGREVPPVWAERAAEGSLPAVLSSMLEGGGIFGPHWGMGERGDAYSGPGGTFFA